MSQTSQTSEHRFPFSAVVGLDDVKLALLLVANDPAIGGVLLRGQKGSAKTTLARALAALLPGDAPFVELPIGATEDRVVGTIDLAAALTAGERRFEPGLLASAHGGVLYVDEVNLLPDHLVDVLLDVAASGVNRVEREGVSHIHPSRFVLIGSMNPEEGELRPQLLDRFGLAVDVTAPTDAGVRAEAVRRRLEFDADPATLSKQWGDAEAALRDQLAHARPASVVPELVDAISALCAAVGAEGLRADIVICRAAAALAGFSGRDTATADDVERVAPLALAHRRRRSPFQEPGIEQEELQQALDQSFGREPSGAPERVAPPDEPPRIIGLEQPKVESPRGRLVAERPIPDDRPVTALAVGATARAAAVRRAIATEPDAAPLTRADLREPVRVQRAATLVVLAVDASGSMGAERRMEAAKGAVIGLLLDAYQRRDRVALVAFRGDEADVVLRPTGSVEVARARLTDLPTGGRTPLAAGIDAALSVARNTRDHRPLLVLVSDGRATAAPDGVDAVTAARAAAERVRKQKIDAVVVDAETGPTRLGLARELAVAMDARYLTLAELSAGTLRAISEEMR